MSQTILDLLKEGVEANISDSFRQGNLVSLPADVQLVITGDLHGHQRNFERIISFADLANNPARHVILQEIIHGGPADSDGGCLSYKLLFDAVKYKLDFPDRVHIVMGNHDTSFINNRKIIKDGREMNRAMRLAIRREFENGSDEILLGIKELLLSQPLAVRCDNRIWISHSLPADRYFDKFDSQVFDRPLQADDIIKPGSAYLLTWGRNMSQLLLDKLAKLFDVDIFILGHQPQNKGWGQVGKNLLIIACDHNHGCLLPVDLAKSYNITELVDSIVPLASIP